MKKVLLYTFLFFSIVFSYCGTLVEEPYVISYQKEHVVYITKTGTKYHRGTCGHLSKSKIEVKLKDAIKNGYQACKNCKP